MHILAVSITSRAHQLGGMEDHLHTLVAGLARHGHDVTVLTSRHPDGRVEEKVDGVRWRYLDSPSSIFASAWKTATLAAYEELRREGPIDVVHSQSSGALHLVKARIPTPIVFSLHGNYVSILRAALSSVRRRPTPRVIAREARGLARVSGVHFRQGNWRAFRPCEAIVPSVSQLTPSILAHSLRRGHVHVVLNGIDTQLFRLRSRAEVRAGLELPLATPVLACVGRLDRAKGAAVAVEALARLNGAGAGTLLVLVGDGPHRERLDDLARRLGVHGRVVFTGREPEGRVAQYMAAADVFLFPSRLAEAGPLVVAQAMASGTPVVASSTGAVPEMLGADGTAGVLVPVGRPAAIAEAVEHLLADPELRERMGAAGRVRAVEHHAIDQMVEQTLAVYLRALEQTGKAPVSRPARPLVGRH